MLHGPEKTTDLFSSSVSDDIIPYKNTSSSSSSFVEYHVLSSFCSPQSADDILMISSITGRSTEQNRCRVTILNLHWLQLLVTDLIFFRSYLSTELCRYQVKSLSGFLFTLLSGSLPAEMVWKKKTDLPWIGATPSSHYSSTPTPESPGPSPPTLRAGARVTCHWRSRRCGDTPR